MFFFFLIRPRPLSCVFLTVIHLWGLAMQHQSLQSCHISHFYVIEKHYTSKFCTGGGETRSIFTSIKTVLCLLCMQVTSGPQTSHMSLMAVAFKLYCEQPKNCELGIKTCCVNVALHLILLTLTTGLDKIEPMLLHDRHEVWRSYSEHLPDAVTTTLCGRVKWRNQMYSWTRWSLLLDNSINRGIMGRFCLENTLFLLSSSHKVTATDSYLNNLCMTCTQTVNLWTSVVTLLQALYYLWKTFQSWGEYGKYDTLG